MREPRASVQERWRARSTCRRTSDPGRQSPACRAASPTEHPAIAGKRHLQPGKWGRGAVGAGKPVARGAWPPEPHLPAGAHGAGAEGQLQGAVHTPGAACFPPASAVLRGHKPRATNALAAFLRGQTGPVWTPGARCPEGSQEPSRHQPCSPAPAPTPQQWTSVLSFPALPSLLPARSITSKGAGGLQVRDTAGRPPLRAVRTDWLCCVTHTPKPGGSHESPAVASDPHGPHSWRLVSGRPQVQSGRKNAEDQEPAFRVRPWVTHGSSDEGHGKKCARHRGPQSTAWCSVRPRSGSIPDANHRLSFCQVFLVLRVLVPSGMSLDSKKEAGLLFFCELGDSCPVQDLFTPHSSLWPITCTQPGLVQAQLPCLWSLAQDEGAKPLSPSVHPSGSGLLSVSQ